MEKTESPFWATKYSGNANQHYKEVSGDFPGGAVVKNQPAKAGDPGSCPDPGRPHMPRSN